jgi:hypothetical protein
MRQRASSPRRGPTIGHTSDMRASVDSGQEPAYRGPDRRTKPTPRLSRYALWGGRRREARRREEREGSFVDVHGQRLFALVLWIALMNVGDSFFTLVHLQAGGVELNPVAKLLLTSGRWNFVFVKSLLIGIALAVLALHKNFHLARIGLWTAASTYTCLVGYHLLLFRIT